MGQWMELTLFIIIYKIFLCKGNILETYSPTYPECISLIQTSLIINLDIPQSNQANNQINHHSGYLANTFLPLYIVHCCWGLFFHFAIADCSAAGPDNDNGERHERLQYAPTHDPTVLVTDTSHPHS